MNKKLVFGLVGVVAVLSIYVISTYNSLVSGSINVDKAWAKVETQYQRRFDLIPNVVEVVKTYAKHEKEVFESVTKARAEVAKQNINISDATDLQLANFIGAQDALGTSLSKLLMTKEAYPDLKANQSFEGLMAQLRGCENRISHARKEFNKVSAEYNTDVRQFPSNIVAGIFGFRKKAMFEADGGAENAVQVKID